MTFVYILVHAPRGCLDDASGCEDRPFLAALAQLVERSFRKA